MKLTGAAILVSRGMKVLQAAPATYPNRYAAWSMAVAFEYPDGHRPATEQDVTHLEMAIAAVLPADYCAFLLQHNGGYPKPSGFCNGHEVVSSFFGFCEKNNWENQRGRGPFSIRIIVCLLFVVAGGFAEPWRGGWIEHVRPIRTTPRRDWEL